MRAAWYENQGAARDVLVVGEMPDPSHSTTPSPENKSISRQLCRPDSHCIRPPPLLEIPFRQLGPADFPRASGIYFVSTSDCPRRSNEWLTAAASNSPWLIGA